LGIEQVLVTVVVPAYNAARYLKECLDSILAQIGRAIDVIVVDDGSTDETADIVATYGTKLRYIYQANSGGCANPRNTGATACTGKYITFFDADDVMVPGKIARQVDFFFRHSEAGMAAIPGELKISVNWGDSGAVILRSGIGDLRLDG